MALQAYVDDSGQEDGCFVLSGYVAPAANWAKFSHQWERLLPTHGVLADDNVYHFKMQEMMASAERRARIPAFEYEIYSAAVFEFAIGLFIGDFKSAMDRVVVPGIDLSRLRPTITAFHLCYFVLMETLSVWLRDSGQKLVAEPVEFFFDKQSEGRHILKNWAGFIDAHPYIKGMTASAPRFEDDRKFLPLQAADYLAHNFRRKMQGEIDSFRWANAKPEGFPGLYLGLNEGNLVGAYFRILRQTFPDRLIFDTKSALHPVLQEEEFLTGWRMHIERRDA